MLFYSMQQSNHGYKYGNNGMQGVKISSNPSFLELRTPHCIPRNVQKWPKSSPRCAQKVSPDLFKRAPGWLVGPARMLFTNQNEFPDNSCGWVLGLQGGLWGHHACKARQVQPHKVNRWYQEMGRGAWQDAGWDCCRL